MMKTTMSLAVLALITETSAVELKNENHLKADGMNFVSSLVEDGEMDDTMLLEVASAINSYSSSFEALEKKHKKKHHHKK